MYLPISSISSEVRALPFAAPNAARSVATIRAFSNDTRSSNFFENSNMNCAESLP